MVQEQDSRANLAHDVCISLVNLSELDPFAATASLPWARLPWHKMTLCIIGVENEYSASEAKKAPHIQARGCDEGLIPSAFAS